MAGAAKDPAYAKRMGIPQHVARDYAEADKGDSNNKRRIVKALSDRTQTGKK